MSPDIFLKLDTIKGESKDSKHKGEIDIESFTFGLSNGGSWGAGGGAAGFAAGVNASGLRSPSMRETSRPAPPTSLSDTRITRRSMPAPVASPPPNDEKSTMP